jgi:hypothetical protein
MAKIIGNVVGMPSPPQEVGVVDWDFYQMNGSRTNYAYAFAEIWNDENFRPKYNIYPNRYGDNMFAQAKGITDLKGILESCGVVLNTSRLKEFRKGFQGCTNLTRLPEISFEKVVTTDNIYYCFGACPSLKSIDNLKMPSWHLPITEVFNGSTSLTYIRVEGKIYDNFDISPCPLDPDSLRNIIKHLQNYSGSSNEYAYVVAFNSEAFAVLEAEGFNEEDKQWYDETFGEPWTEKAEWWLCVDNLGWGFVE